MILRATGPFTVSLLSRLLDTLKTKEPCKTFQLICKGSPKLELEPRQTTPRFLVGGFYKGPSRLEQALGHEVMIMVAADIGVTLYLAFLGALKRNF